MTSTAPEKNLKTFKADRESMSQVRSGILMAGMVVGTAGSLGRFDYNIALFMFELIREKYFNEGYLGADTKVYNPAWTNAKQNDPAEAKNKPLWNRT